MDVMMDGTRYRVHVKMDSFSESFQIKDGPNATTSIVGSDIRDIIGTYFSHEMAVEPDWNYFADYLAFYNALCQPVPYHNVQVPHGQSLMTYKAKVLSGKHNLKKQLSNGTNLYNGFVVKYMPIEPQIEPD
jgi:hypothetical protein